MPKEQELSGVVSLDLRKQPEIPASQKTVEAQAKAFVVDSEDSYSAGVALIQSSAGAIAKVEAFFESDKSLAYQLHASICEKIRTITAPWRAVRPAIEPKLKAYRKAQDDIRRAEEQRLARESEQARIAAATEAARIQREADEKAALLKRQGELSAAREVKAEAQEQAIAVMDAADVVADVGTILPAAPRTSGLGESRPWIGVIDSPLEVLQAIASGKIPLMYTIPKRGGGTEEVPLVTINQQVVTYAAKRLGKQDIGIPGTHGERDISLRISSKGAVGSAASTGDEW